MLKIGSSGLRLRNFLGKYQDVPTQFPADALPEVQALLVFADNEDVALLNALRLQRV